MPSPWLEDVGSNGEGLGVVRSQERGSQHEERPVAGVLVRAFGQHELRHHVGIRPERFGVLQPDDTALVNVKLRDNNAQHLRRPVIRARRHRAANSGSELAAMEAAPVSTVAEDAGALTRRQELRECRTMFFLGFLGLPWLWLVNWFQYRGKNPPHSDPEVAVYARRSLVGALTGFVVFLSYFVAVQCTWRGWAPDSFMVNAPPDKGSF